MFAASLAQSAAIVGPLFALIAIGFGASRLKLVGESSASGLSDFVFVIAIPALLFRTLATSPLPSAPPYGYWLTYFLALATVWFLAAQGARLAGRDGREGAIIGFSAAQANTVMVGIPLILGVFGERGTLPILLLLLVHLPVTMSAATLLIARGENGGAGRLIRSLASHPILLAIFAGALWRLAGFSLPEIPAKVLRFLGDTAAPCALVAMGMSLTRVRLAGNRGLLAMLVVLKLAVQPILVFLLGSYVFGLDPVFLGAAILFAACPTGINAFLLAERYRTAESIASGAIAVSTLLAVFTATLAVAFVMGLR